MFKKTLDMIPNGVLIIDIASKKITFANKEMEDIVNLSKCTGLADRFKSIRESICLFKVYDHNQLVNENNNNISVSKNEKLEKLISDNTFSSGVGSNIEDKRFNDRENLWEYLIEILENQSFKKVDKVFKACCPKRYIQVKTSLINEGSQIIAICSDITRIKEVEK